jgi:uncharacterized protein
MDFDKMRESENVEDRRGQGGNIPSGRVGRGSLGRGGGGARLGLGGLVVVVVGSLLFGLNPADVLNQLQGGGQVTQTSPSNSNTGASVNSNDPGLIFSKKVMGDLEDTWGNIFKTQLNGTYQAPKLVLFSNGTRTGCGNGESAMGPFYCPPDQTAYLDLTFFRELEGTASAGGDLARSYVIAHEIGHHVQNLLGISSKVEAKRREVNEVTGNQLSVRVELQADCFAGIWAHSAAQRGIIKTEAEVQTAIKTAMEIGDDYLQRKARGYVVEEAFTHGSSAQRARWFKTGFDSGLVKDCNTFAAQRL